MVCPPIVNAAVHTHFMEYFCWQKIAENFARAKSVKIDERK